MLCIIGLLLGDVPKWLKGPHSKCGRVLIAPREFKSLHLRQKRNLPSRAGFFFRCSVFELERCEHRGQRLRAPPVADTASRGWCSGRNAASDKRDHRISGTANRAIKSLRSTLAFSL